MITASLSLADLPATARLWHQRQGRVHACRSSPSLGVALLGRAAGHRDRGRPVDPQRLPPGLAAVPDTTLGLVDGLPGYHDVRSYPDARLLPGLVIYRFDAPLFFANAKTFRDEILRSPAASRRREWIVVAAEPITDVDTTAADVLFDLDRLLDGAGPDPGLRRAEGPGARARSSATGWPGRSSRGTSSRRSRPPWTRSGRRPVRSGDRPARVRPRPPDRSNRPPGSAPRPRESSDRPVPGSSS